MTEAAVSKSHELATLSEEVHKLINVESTNGAAQTDDMTDGAYTRSRALTGRGHLQRSSTQFTKNKMQCWMSFDMHLNDIQLARERFLMNCWLLVFWKDPDGEFEALFDEQTLSTIKEHGNSSTVYFDS